MTDDDIDAELLRNVMCANPNCTYGGVVQARDLHDSGLCGACCPKLGPITCSICWPHLDIDGEGEDDE